MRSYQRFVLERFFQHFRIAKFLELLFDLVFNHPFALCYTDKRHCNETPHGICHEIPSGILVSADIGVLDEEGCKEFNDLIYSPQPHAGNGAEEDDACCGIVVAQRGAQCLPTDPGRNTESISMNDVIVFEEIGDKPPAIEHIFFSVDRPGMGDGCEAADHVEGAPDTEAPECFIGQRGTAVNRKDKDDQEDHHANIEGKFPVLVLHCKHRSDHEIGCGECSHGAEFRESWRNARHSDAREQDQIFGGSAGDRTQDQCLKRALLYQLSYRP